MITHSRLKNKIKKNFYFINKKDMQKFICGNVTRNKIICNDKKLYLNHVHWKDKDVDINKINEFDKLEKKLFSPSKVVHGFGAIILENEKIAFSCHTSKEMSKVHGINLLNISVKESINPIKFVNPVQIMSIENFKKYYKIDEPDDMLSNVRYGSGHEAHDLNYLSFRAFWQSLCSKESVIGLKFKEEIIVFNDTMVGDDVSVWTPAQALIDDEFDRNNGYLTNLVKEMTKEIIDFEEGKKSKEDFLELVKTNYTNFIENKEYVKDVEKVVGDSE